MRWEHDRIAEIEYADGRRRFEWRDGLPVGGDYDGHHVARELDERYRMRIEKQDDQEVAYTYDASDNLVGISTSLGRQIRFAYDLRRRVTGIADSRCGSHQFSYGSGFEMLGWQIEGGCAVRFRHHPDGLLEGFTVLDAKGRLVAEHGSVYRADGKVLRQTFRTPAGAAEYRYFYDAAGRPRKSCKAMRRWPPIVTTPMAT